MFRFSNIHCQVAFWSPFCEVQVNRKYNNLILFGHMPLIWVVESTRKTKRESHLISSILPIWFSGRWLFLINISSSGPRRQRSDLLIPQSSQQTLNLITNQGVDLYAMAKPIFSNFHMEYPITGQKFNYVVVKCFKLCSHQQGNVYQFAWFLLYAQIICQDRSVQFDWQ